MSRKFSKRQCCIFQEIQPKNSTSSRRLAAVFLFRLLGVIRLAVVRGHTNLSYIYDPAQIDRKAARLQQETPHICFKSGKSGSMEKKWAEADEGQWAEAATAGSAGGAAPRVKEQRHCRRRAKCPMSPTEACEIIGNAWRRRLERECRLLEELKEATSLLRNEAACVVQSCFRGFLLRKALGEELQTTVIRWKNPPPGKRHEAEVSIPDPPKWTKKIPMHFCPVRQAYVCSVPVVKGRLLVRFLVDNKAFPVHPDTTKGANPANSPGVLLLPGSSLGERIAPQYPWKEARRWLQQQQLQHEQRLQELENQEQQKQLREADEEQLKPQERQKPQEASTPSQEAQYFLEKGALEAPLRPPRRFDAGLLGSSDISSSWNSSRNEQNVYSWGAPCRPPFSPTGSSGTSEERELSPLQKRPSWASGARLDQERQARVPPRWRQQQQQHRQQQGQEQEQQTERQGQQGQQQHHSPEEYGCIQHRYEGPWAFPSSSKSADYSDAEDIGFPCSPISSSGKAATREATTQTTTTMATTGSAGFSTCCGEVSQSLCSPQLPAAPSSWAFCPSSRYSPRGLSPRGELPVTPLSTPVSQQQPWGQPLHRWSLSPLLGKSKAPQEVLRKEEEWHTLADEEFEWNSWPWGHSMSPPPVDSLGPRLRDTGVAEHEAKFLTGCSCLDRWADATASESCSCKTNDSVHLSATTSSHQRGGQRPTRPLRKCRDSLIDSADLTGGLLWARRRSHSYWELRKPFSTSHLLLRFTRSLSLQW